MANITLKGNPIHTIGNLPKTGQAAPDFTLTAVDLSEVTLKTYAGKKVILNIFPSIDTPTCATAEKRFNDMADQLGKVMVLCISADLPFAQKRFCGMEDLQHVIALSSFRHPEFGKHYGVTITDGPIAGLLSRTIVIIDEKGIVTYTQQVAELSAEPDYQAVMAAL